MTCGSGLDVPDMFPSIDSADRRFAFLHWVLQGKFPSFTGTTKALRLPTARFASLRFLRLAIPRLHSLVSLPGGRVRRRGLELVTRCSIRDFAEEIAGSPKFLGNLDYPFAMFQTDAGGTARTRPLQYSSAAPGHRKARAPTIGSFDAQ